jgi:hypothetical protein
MVYAKKALEGGGKVRRSIAVDYPHYNDDGTIKPVVQTVVGTAGPEGPYQTIAGRDSGKVLDVRSNSTADGAAIIQWRSSALAANQQWFFRDAGNGYYNVVNRNSENASTSRVRAGRTVRPSYSGPATAAPTSSGP